MEKDINLYGSSPQLRAKVGVKCFFSLALITDSVGNTFHHAALAEMAFIKTIKNNKHLVFCIPHIATMCCSVS